jgi:hypothetical protein
LRIYKIAYLSMEMRTGKTATALAAASKYGAKSVLFLTKKKAISSIEKDYNALGRPFALDAINYEQLNNVDSNPEETLPVTRGNIGLVICDEAHCLGQFPTPAERTKKLKKLCDGKPIIYLSGTPTPESYSQIFHQFWISSFSPFPEINFYKWAKEFVFVKKKYFFNREVNDYSFANKQKVDQYIQHLFISYTQEAAGFSQEIEEQVIKIKMQPGTYKLADWLIKNRVYEGKQDKDDPTKQPPVVLADTAVKLQTKLHQIYSGTVKFEDGNSHCFDHTKAQYIKEHFKGKKIAIFYKFIAEAMMLVGTFGYDRLTDDPEKFNESDDLIFYAQFISGREGVNLSTADALVYLNIDFSSVSYQQSRARIQSKDRTDPARLYWIFADGGIEEKIYQRVINKQDFTLSYFKQIYKVKDEIKLTAEQEKFIKKIV